MSFPVYSTNELVKTVRLRGGLANSGQLGTTGSEIIQLLNEELRTKFLPGVMKVREEYFVFTKRYTISSARLRIPHRAIGLKLRDLKIVDANGLYTPMTKLNPTDTARPNAGGLSSGFVGFIIEGNHIVLIPEGNPSTGSLQVSFFMRPGYLVPNSEVAVVQSVTGNDITLTTAPPVAWTGVARYDVHSPHSGAEVKQWELTATNLLGNVLTVAEAINGSVYGTSAVEPGDYVCLSGEAAIPGVPVELHPPLALSAAVSILTTLDPERAIVKKQDLDYQLGMLGYAIDQRTEGKPVRVGGR